VKRGSVRRSKLYYLRNRVGKRALKINNVEEVYFTDEIEVPEVAEEPTEEVVEEKVEESTEEK
jgi:hypothetical protein